MNLILKGIDLPNCSNEDCIVVIRKDKAEVWQTGFKERTAEAIPIPKDHGDIKDVGKLEDELDSRCGQLSAEIVRNAPTILESEE